MKLLIYGAGVIGCLYAALFSKAGYNTTIYARGKRLESLEKEGLLYWNGDEIHSANVTIINKLHKNDTYDYIFLTVRENQLMILVTPGQHSCNTRTHVPTTSGQAFLFYTDIHS